MYVGQNTDDTAVSPLSIPRIKDLSHLCLIGFYFLVHVEVKPPNISRVPKLVSLFSKPSRGAPVVLQPILNTELPCAVEAKRVQCHPLYVRAFQPSLLMCGDTVFFFFLYIKVFFLCFRRCMTCSLLSLLFPQNTSKSSFRLSD